MKSGDLCIFWYNKEYRLHDKVMIDNIVGHMIFCTRQRDGKKLQCCRDMLDIVEMAEAEYVI